MSYRNKLILTISSVFLVFAAGAVCLGLVSEDSYRRAIIKSRLEGYADMIVGHECTLNIFLAEDEGRYRMLENTLGTAELGVAFQKGTHEELARQLEQTMAEMAADGTVAEILTAYGVNGIVRMGGIESK